MNNPRITAKERGLLKGAIRRVFSRSDLRRKVLDTADIAHTDATRPRVKKWSRCPVCKQPTPRYTMQVDHTIPLVPLDKSLEEMDWSAIIDRAWCVENNLMPMCKPCHKAKTKEENAIRRKLKKGR